MSDKIKSFQINLIIRCIISLFLALLTEAAAGTFLFIVGRQLGPARRGYGWDDEKIRQMQEQYRGRKIIPDYRSIRRLDKGTITCIIVVIIVMAVVLYILYFWLLTRKITQDMKYISRGIERIASGEMDEPLTLSRRDELGEIAERVNWMSDEIVRLMESERDAMQTNKDMIACVAHDLRTPVTSIVGYLQLATDMETYTLAERQKYARVAMQKANRLERLIEELFSFTKLMTGEISLHRGDVDIVKLVEQMLEEFYPIFQENGLECNLECDINSLILFLDGELLARAVQNLLSNATKYGKDGKRILVHVEKLETEVQIAVTNFGLVIPEESVAHLFDKFYRVEGSRSVGNGGTGLGLNIAQEIAHLHGGDIQAESSIQGTTFTIALPLGENNREVESNENGK